MSGKSKTTEGKDQTKKVSGNKKNPYRLLFLNKSGDHENEEDMENGHITSTPSEVPQSFLRKLVGHCKISHFAFGAPHRLRR